MITTLNEYVDFNKIKDISIEISNRLRYENIFILRNIDNPRIFTIENNKIVSTNKKLFKMENLIDNYKYYFDKYDIQKSEIIKMEYDSYNWIVIFLCYTKDTNYSMLSYSPDLNNSDAILKLNTFLEEKNFEIIKNKFGVKKLNSLFINGLVKILRNLSGRYYSPSNFGSVKQEFDQYKKDNSEQWDLYEKWKLKNLGSSLKCVRFMNLSQNMDILLVTNKFKKVKDLTEEDLFYYPISKRIFSQWAQYKEDIETLKDDLGGISSSVNFGVVSDIPTKQIVFASSILMNSVSPHVKEREVLVQHDNNEEWDMKIICKIV